MSIDVASFEHGLVVSLGIALIVLGAAGLGFGRERGLPSRGRRQWSRR